MTRGLNDMYKFLMESTTQWNGDYSDKWVVNNSQHKQNTVNGGWKTKLVQWMDTFNGESLHRHLMFILSVAGTFKLDPTIPGQSDVAEFAR